MNSSLNLIIFTFLPFFLHEILSVSYDGKMMCLLETWGVTTFFFCSQMFLMSETTAPTSTTLTRETQTGMAWATTVTTAPWCTTLIRWWNVSKQGSVVLSCCPEISLWGRPASQTRVCHILKQLQEDVSVWFSSALPRWQHRFFYNLSWNLLPSPNISMLYLGGHRPSEEVASPHCLGGYLSPWLPWGKLRPSYISKFAVERDKKNVT